MNSASTLHPSPWLKCQEDVDEGRQMVLFIILTEEPSLSPVAERRWTSLVVGTVPNLRAKRVKTYHAALRRLGQSQPRRCKPNATGSHGPSAAARSQRKPCDMSSCPLAASFTACLHLASPCDRPTSTPSAISCRSSCRGKSHMALTTSAGALVTRTDSLSFASPAAWRAKGEHCVCVPKADRVDAGH